MNSLNIIVRYLSKSLEQGDKKHAAQITQESRSLCEPVRTIYGTWNEITPQGASLDNLLILSNDTQQHLKAIYRSH